MTAQNAAEMLGDAWRELVEFLVANPVVALFAVIALGAALGDVVIECGDHVRAVGAETELKSLELLLGHRVQDVAVAGFVACLRGGLPDGADQRHRPRAPGGQGA